MSARALALAVRNHLRAQLSLAATACEITDDGRPLPRSAGPFFYGVVQGDFRGGEDPDLGLDEYYNVDVVVTAWAAKVPADRLGPNLIAGPTGQSLDEKVEAVRALLHKDPPTVADPVTHYPVLRAANALIGVSRNGFAEPLLFLSGSRVEPKGAEWFYSEGTSSAHYGLAITLSFGRARRVQVVTEQS